MATSKRFRAALHRPAAGASYRARPAEWGRKRPAAASPRATYRTAGPVRRRGRWRGLVLGGLAGIAVAAVLFGYASYAAVRDMVACAELPYLLADGAGLARPTPAPVVAVAATPSPTVEPPPVKPVPAVEPELPERVNILLLGIDRRQGETGPCRSDAMVLVSLDPLRKAASILSIPRDLWVAIPQAGGRYLQDRINTAHYYGERDRFPNGGPGLAMATVRHNLGITVQHYVRVDFQGFVRIIDELGGIDIDVPADMVDARYPTASFGTMTVRFRRGRQRLDGERALQYARMRHGGSDLDRIRRQQQILVAVRERVLGLDYPPTRIPALVQALRGAVETDLGPAELVAVARAALQVGPGNIRRAAIDETMVIDWVTPRGAAVLLPQRARIQRLVADLFAPAP